MSDGCDEQTDFMQPAPLPNPDETGEEEDQLVADPISEQTERLLRETAHSNREIFSEIFKNVPTNVVRNWKTYDVCFSISISRPRLKGFMCRIMSLRLRPATLPLVSPSTVLKKN